MRRRAGKTGRVSMANGTRFLLASKLLVVAAIAGVGGYELWRVRAARERSTLDLERLTELMQSAQSSLSESLQSLAERSREDPSDGVSLEQVSALLQQRLESVLERQVQPTVATAVETSTVASAELAAVGAGAEGEFSAIEASAAERSEMPPAERSLQEIHFLLDSEHLTPGAQRKVLLAARDIVTERPQQVRIVGFTDSLGEPIYNAQLSRRRAESVAQALMAAGVAGAMVEIVAQGEAALPEPTGDEVAEPLNRCVAIVAVSR